MAQGGDGAYFSIESLAELFPGKLDGDIAAHARIGPSFPPADAVMSNPCS